MHKEHSNRTFLYILLLVIVAGGVWVAMRMTASNEVSSADDSLQVVLPMVAFPTHEQLTSGFTQGMTEFGYEEGEDVEYLGPDAPITPNEAGIAEIRETMREYIENGADMIIVSANPDAAIALEETAAAGRDIPIVGLDLFDPVEKGLVESYEAPGDNLTGVAEKRADSVGRFLDIFTLIVPSIESMGVLTEGFMIPSPTAPAQDFLEALRGQADEFDIELVEYATESDDPEAALVQTLEEVEEGEVDAWVHMPGHFIHDQQVHEHEMGLRTNTPVGMPATIEIDPETEEIAGLFAYGANFTQKGMQGAGLVDKILRGAEAGELPIESPAKYDLIINASVAEDIGVEITPEVLELADSIIE